MIFPIFLSYLIGISSGAEAYRRPETIKPPLTGDAVQNLGEHLHRKVVEQDSPHSTGDLLNNGTGLHRVTHFYPSQLFADVQLKRLFPDSKTFCDMIPVRRTIDEIIKEYSSLDHSSPSFSLTKFVLDNFEFPELIADDIFAEKGEDMHSYMDRLWPHLRRSFNTTDRAETSLLPLPKPGVVPGGRFREAYYWDSGFAVVYFLTDPEKQEWAIDILDNFADQIDKFGYILNGNRDYYVGRSQPPVFGMMIDALMKVNDTAALKYREPLQKEYEWWGRERQPGAHSSEGRSIRLKDGSLVTTYGAAHDTGPRPEAFLEDTQAAQHAPPDAKHVFEDIQAAAESGWDFSSRFARECEPTPCLHTTSYAPVDLNALLGHSANVLAKLHRLAGDEEMADRMVKAANDRAVVINKHFWDEDRGTYNDLLWEDGIMSAHLSAAAVAPLVFGQAEPERATKTLNMVRDQLLTDCGVRTTLHASAHQWDKPFGWGPLQYWAALAADRFDRPELSQKIREGWIRNVRETFLETGQMYEKYDVELCRPAQAGEYATQSGFTFTNAVVALFLQW